MRLSMLALLVWTASAGLLSAGEFTPLSSNIEVQPFTLTERHGETVSPADLRGKIWIAHFFYPTCRMDCTKTVPTMRRLNQIFAGKSDVVLVSFALTGDDPELLRQYARDQEADEKQWLFLTEDRAKKQDVLAVVEKCFFQTAKRKENPSPGDEIDHVPTLWLIDRQGNMLGYVDGRNPDNIPILVERVRQLAAQRYVQPAVNAGLNTLCTVLLLLGWGAIKLRQEMLHKVCMLAALATSAAFLASYLWFHFAVLDGQPTRFRGEGAVRVAYFAILLSHTFLAAVVAPLALYTAYQGVRDRRPRHVRIARWTLPIWLYVSVTGVVVYVLLYQVYPPY
jgi:uncharacterized membrane protein YozB (DUF420 family)/cytochrome oxidase Cu insertion factor (SCO1/SenC/PrrC family)